jgi:hypothetical protein
MLRTGTFTVVNILIFNTGIYLWTDNKCFFLLAPFIPGERNFFKVQWHEIFDTWFFFSHQNIISGSLIAGLHSRFEYGLKDNQK